MTQDTHDPDNAPDIHQENRSASSLIYEVEKDRKVRKVSQDAILFILAIRPVHLVAVVSYVYENHATPTYPIPPQPSLSIAPSPALFTVAHQCKVSLAKAAVSIPCMVTKLVEPVIQW